MDTVLLAERVELIEESVRALVTIPARMESMERRFADIEGRMVSVEGRLVSLEGRLVNVEERLVNVEGRLVVVEGQIVQLRGEMHGEFSAIRDNMNERFDALYERGEDTRRFMRVLHEEVLDRVGRLGEGRSAL